MNNLHLFEAARKKLGLDESFKWSFAKSLSNDIMQIEFAQRRPLKSGPRKGQEVAKPPFHKTYITTAEGEKEQARYEAETGNCGECMGEKQNVIAWHRDRGNTYEPCKRCSGTGAVGLAPITDKGGDE